MFWTHRNPERSDDENGTTICGGKLACSSDQEGIHIFMLKLWIICIVMFFLGGCGRTIHPGSEGFHNQIPDKEMRLVVWDNHEAALTASIAFEYQTYKNYPGVGGWTDFPLSPNKWNIQMQMTNEDSRVFDIIPIFLFNERYKKDTQWIENSMAISPLHYQARLRREVPFPVRGVPEYAPGVVSENVFLQRNQHDFPPSKEETGGFYSVLNMRASLEKAGERQRWSRQALSPRTTLDIEWDSWSIWAFPEHIRQTKDLFVSTLGPVLIKAGKNTHHAMIPVVEFVADNPKNFHRLNGKNVKVIELSITGIRSIEGSSPEIHAFLQAVLKEFPEE